MRKLGFVCIVAGLLLIGASLWLRLAGPGVARVPAAVAELERSLARPGLLGLATLDVAALSDLGVAQDEAAGGDADGLRALLASAGIDPARDVHHATLALFLGAGGEAEVAVALFGRFDRQAVERALAAREDWTVASVGSADEPLLQVVRTDRESCEESGPWAVHVEAGRLLVASPGAIGEILSGAGTSDAALRDLARFQSFREGRLVSAAVFVPEELPDVANPIVGMAAHGAKQQVDGFRALYAGAAPQRLPPGLAVEAQLEGVRPGVAAAKAAAWQGWLDERLARLGGKVPTLATLHEALELRAEGDDLHASFRLSREDALQLEKLPAELGALLFEGSGFQLGGGGAPAEERLAQDPPVYRAQLSRADLPAYDPGVTFAEPVEQVQGPFGLRLAAVRIARKGAAAGGEVSAQSDRDGVTELEVEAFATRLPNLGNSEERASIRITAVEGRSGEALLAPEVCGPQRNELPAPLSNHFGGEVLKGTKAVRLRAGAHPDDVARIVGVASLRLPTRTETVRVPAEPGLVERAGARLEIKRVEGGSVSYALAGDRDGLLELRALNEAGRVLASDGKSSMAGFGGGLSVSESFAGAVHRLEAVFALEQEEIPYPFSLEDPRPGTAGELVTGEPYATAPGAVRIRGAFRDWLARVAGSVAPARASGMDAGTPPAVAAGPFAVRLQGLWPFGGLMPRIEVRAPRIPGVADSPSAVALRLTELHLLDGTVQRGDWREALALSQEFGGEALVATSQLDTGVSASPDDVASLHGRITIRLPARMRGEELEHAELGARLERPDLDLRLVELARDRFVLRARKGGERVMGAQAFNADGLPLFTQHAGSETLPEGSLELAFQVRGVPRRIELRVADELAEAEYPFVLRNGDRSVAQAR